MQLKNYYKKEKIGRSRVKNFVYSFDFENPDWGNLPVGFPDLPKYGLSKEETCVLEAIVLAWTTSAGRGFLYRKTARLGFFVVAISFIGIFGFNFFRTPEYAQTKSVNAATISATLKQMNIGNDSPIDIEGIVESTMSAVLSK